jgi:ABC-type uncharacterized transport system ATPase subunit
MTIILVLLASAFVAMKVEKDHGAVAAFGAAVAVLLIGSLLLTGDMMAVINSVPGPSSDNCYGRC